MTTVAKQFLVASTAPIREAVEPLKADAIERAEQEAKEHTTLVSQELATLGWDLQRAAPYPRSSQCPTPAHYHMMLSRHRMFSFITRSVEPSHRMGGPNIVAMARPGASSSSKTAGPLLAFSTMPSWPS